MDESPAQRKSAPAAFCRSFAHGIRLIERTAESLTRAAAALAAVILAASIQVRAAGELDLEFIPLAGDVALPAGSAFDTTANGRLTVSRLDFLVTGLALQREDGTWIESAPDWVDFVSLGKRRLTVKTTGVAEADYQRIRFRIGVTPETDRQDVSSFAPGHPLHPDVCGLHWSWQGGYIYLALEGRSSRTLHGADGFSFHLAREGNAPWVELPVRFRGGGPVTIRVAMDVPSVLTGVDFQQHGNATHSRDGDAIPVLMKRNLASAFRIDSVKSDVFTRARAEGGVVSALPEGTRAYPLEIPSRFPKVALPADNPLTVEGVELGRRLFHENRLSVNDSISCASCHQPETGFSDARRFSIGAEGHAGKRRSMPLVNLAWQKELFWDGRAPSLREQVLMPIRDAHEMNETPENVVSKLAKDPVYQNLFGKAFASPGVTVDRMARALEQFLLTLISHESRFDLALRQAGELTETEKRGLQLFVTEHAPERGLRGADCFHCHGGMLFSDHAFHDNGLALDDSDTGRMQVTGNPADRGKFKTPTLRNVALRAPYMHDGRFATLEEVVEHYNSGVRRRPTLDPNLAKHPAGGLGLSTEEKHELVAFLRTLTDQSKSPVPPESPTASQP